MPSESKIPLSISRQIVTNQVPEAPSQSLISAVFIQITAISKQLPQILHCLASCRVVILLIIVIENILHHLQVFIILGIINNRLAREIARCAVSVIYFAILLTGRLFGAVLCAFLLSSRGFSYAYLHSNHPTFRKFYIRTCSRTIICRISFSVGFQWKPCSL